MRIAGSVFIVCDICLRGVEDLGIHVSTDGKDRAIFDICKSCAWVIHRYFECDCPITPDDIEEGYRNDDGEVH